MTREQILEQIANIGNLADHQIPYYAYGDNEAAVALANILETIGNIAAYLTSQMEEVKKPTDEDIQKWVESECEREPMLRYSKAMMIYAAKAMRDGEIVPQK